MESQLSIVTTLYRSEPYLREFYERVSKTAEKITHNFNIIMVNDGSPDNSLEVALEIQKKDPRVVVVDLSRNFGHHRAIMTGLRYAKGDYIFFVDSDLEEEPELLKSFWEEMHKSQDVDLICGIQEKRKGGFFERVSGDVFNKLINKLSDVPIPVNLALARLMTRRYLDSLLLHNETELTFIGISALTGFNQKCVPIKKKHKGVTSYTLNRKINLAFNYITSLSNVPLVYTFYIGLGITFFSFIFLFLLIIRKLFGLAELGWTSVVVSIWLVGGIIIFFLGIIGIYLSKIFIEVKNRPLSIVKNIYINDQKIINVDKKYNFSK